MLKADLKALERDYNAKVNEDYFDRLSESCRSDPKNVKLPDSNGRIFPKYYAPIIYQKNHQRVIEPMRYSVFPPEFVKQPGRYTSFNARRDNLASAFWSESFLKHHGVIILSGFYEWVKVADVLKAGRVSLNEVRKEFERQSNERKARIIAQGKTYKPTKTELKDPQFRDIVINFTPDTTQDLIVPVIFSINPSLPEHLNKGFAIITDEPPPEIREAGHDRTPIFIDKSSIEPWLRSDKLSATTADKLLGHQKKITFEHCLDIAA